MSLADRVHYAVPRTRAALMDEGDILRQKLEQAKQYDEDGDARLTGAESRLAQAKAAALALNLNITNASQASDFHDQDGDVEPGARLSGINHASVGVQSGQISEWVKKLPPGDHVRLSTTSHHPIRAGD